MRKTVEETLRFGGQGIKVKVAGRLNGAEIARTEWHLQGRLPLHTLRADIDYGFAEAHTTFGVIGVKCWIYRGEILDPAAAMARGTQPDPINEPRPERGDGRRPRRDREDGGGDRPRGRGDGRGPGGPGGGRGRGPGGGGGRR
jgi:small subunit ribosomal protein S3